MTIPHSTLTGTQLHGPFRVTFADDAARTTDAGPYVGTESIAGGASSPALALQADTRAVYVLQNHSPVTWVPVDAPASAGSGGLQLEDAASPQPLGTPAPGTATKASAYDHVHPMPTAADVGATTPAEVDSKIAAAGTGSGASIEATAPAVALGTADPGSAATASAYDHVHPMPTAADVGAYTQAETDAAIAAAGGGGGAPSGPAGGDLAGTYPAPTLAAGAVDDPAKIADDTITLAKLRSIAASTVLGNGTGTDATPTELDAAALRTLLGIDPPPTPLVVSGNFDASTESFSDAIEWDTFGAAVLVEVDASAVAGFEGALRWQFAADYASNPGSPTWTEWQGGPFQWDLDAANPSIMQAFTYGAIAGAYRLALDPMVAQTGSIPYTLTRS